MAVKIKFQVNGHEKELKIQPTEFLVDVLRERLGLTGTNKDCRIGVCGSCTVLLNGSAVSSCLLLAVQVDGGKITTIEGLEDAGKLSEIQTAFLMYGAVQCGYCTPGFIMTAKDLLDKNPSPSREEIADALRGNLCRCTGYKKIIDAVESLARREDA